MIGRSLDENCNKMAGFNMLKFLPETDCTTEDGQIKFYYDESNGKVLYIHFQTTFDVCIMEKLLQERADSSAETLDEDISGSAAKSNRRRKYQTNVSFYSYIRTRFAQILLFAIQVCHIIVLVEPNNVFDTSYLNIFKALKVIR